MESWYCRPDAVGGRTRNCELGITCGGYFGAAPSLAGDAEVSAVASRNDAIEYDFIRPPILVPLRSSHSRAESLTVDLREPGQGHWSRIAKITDGSLRDSRKAAEPGSMRENE